ncbi:hypothetical protein hrd7_10580 [Leptolinea sp. HRD-7]|jgi:hypothetical protein|nr:hypothetical protein hrd7_10580 [Leptolinea sp. HRD-7]
MGKNIWTVHTNDNHWGVRIEGNKNLTIRTQTKQEAVNLGKELAKQNHVEHIVQNRDGKISSKDSYGSDTCPPKDTEH